MSVDSPASVALLLDQAVTAPDAATIAALKLPETTVDSAQDFDFLLQHSASGWQLQQTGKPAPGPVRVDFSSGASSYRRNKGGGELIVKAVSGKKQQLPTVLDATAGLGGDAFVLASRGYPVTLLERSPLIALLLADGLRRAANSDDMALREIVGRLHLQQQDSLEYLRELPEARLPDVIYIDPMFPASKKSAQVKKEMQAFQRLLGKDQDSAALLELALAKASHRVVVKRPLKSGCLAAIEPTFCLQGKAVRFDIYALRSFDK